MKHDFLILFFLNNIVSAVAVTENPARYKPESQIFECMIVSLIAGRNWKINWKNSTGNTINLIRFVLDIFGII